MLLCLYEAILESPFVMISHYLTLHYAICHLPFWTAILKAAVTTSCVRRWSSVCNIVTQSTYFPLSFAVAVAAADSYAVEKLKVLEDKYPYIKKPTEDVSTCT